MHGLSVFIVQGWWLDYAVTNFVARPTFVLIAAGVLVLAGCDRRGCAAITVELTIPRGADAPTIKRIDVVAPGSMSGTNVATVARSDSTDDIYEFSTLVFFREERRALVVEMSDGINAVFSLPAGEQAPSSFSAWTVPLYGSTDRIVNLQVLHGDVPTKMAETPSVRARYKFDARDCEY